MKKILCCLSLLSSVFPLSNLTITANINSSNIITTSTNDALTIDAKQIFDQENKDQISGTISYETYENTAHITKANNLYIENATLLNIDENTYFESIGTNAFAFNNNIKGYLKLSTNISAVSIINDLAFEECLNLNSIYIYRGGNILDPQPSRIILGNNIFKNCKNLTNIYIYWCQEDIEYSGSSISDMWLGGITSNHVNLHVPKGTKDIYEEYINTEEIDINQFTIIDDLDNLFHPDPKSDINLTLILGLSLGLGIPILGTAIGIIVYSVKKHKANK